MSYLESLRGLLLAGDTEGARRLLESLSVHTLEALLTSFVTPHLKGVPYTVRWEGGQPRIEVNLPPDEPLVLDVPVDPVERFVVWYMLAGVPNKVWVAEGSTPEKARWAWKTARLRLDRPIVVLLSCPSDHYEREDVRKAWDAKVEELRSLCAVTGTPIEVVDLSALSEEDAVAEVQARLLSEGAQVLGFSHRANTNSFEVGQGGRFGGGAICQFMRESEAREGGSRKETFKGPFLAILGCNPLICGLTDTFVSYGVASTVLTLDVKTAQDMFDAVARLVHFLTERKEGGTTEVAARELLHFAKGWAAG